MLAALGKREGAAAAGAAVAAEVPPKPANRGGAAGLSPVAGEGAAKRGFSFIGVPAGIAPAPPNNGAGAEGAAGFATPGAASRTSLKSALICAMCLR